MKLAEIHTFLHGNLWIYDLIIALFFLIIIFLLISHHKINRKKKFLEKISKADGPLSPHKLLKSLIDAIPDFIYIKDINSKFIIANKQLTDHMGQSGDDIIGLSDHDVYKKEIADPYRRDEIDIMESGESVIEKTEKGYLRNGEEIWVSTSKIPLKNQNGKVVGLVGIGRNITELKNANEEAKSKGDSLQEANTLLEERQEEILNQQEELKVQTEKVLDERNQILTLINSMPDRIYIKDRESRFIIGNIHVAKIMDAKNPEDLIGKTDYDFYPKEMADEYHGDEQKLMENDIQLINKEEPGFDDSGEKIVVSTTKIPVKDDDGNVIGIVGIGRDITTQKEVEKEVLEKSKALQEVNVLLEERQEEIQQQSEELQTQTESLSLANLELEKLSVVASKTGNVIIIMDKDGNFEWVNDGFTEKYGMTLDEFIKAKGKNLRDTSSSEDILKIVEDINKNKKPRLYNSSATDKNGKTIWSQTTISPVLDENGNIIRLIAIDSDISKLKEAEIEIEEQRDKLKTLNATKDKFFSIIAHDLKNPFHSIMGFSDLLSRSFESLEDDKKKEFIKLINESSTSAYGLLENLLHWARTQTNRIKFEPAVLDLRMIIKEIFQMVSVNAENKGVSLIMPEGDDELKVFADYNMINTIIRNFISNSLKFTEKGGVISIQIRNENDRIYIGIKDTGVGMNEENKSKLFRLDEFHSTSGTSGESGTGLGLIICREFAIKHEGEIKVESEVGKGSTFTFDLALNDSTEN